MFKIVTTAMKSAIQELKKKAQRSAKPEKIGVDTNSFDGFPQMVF